MRINISIPPDLPPGHRLGVQGLFQPLGIGPVPPGSQKTLTGTAEVSARRSWPAAAPGLGGFLRQPFLRARFLSTHDEGGFLTGRFLKTGFLEGSPLRVVTLDEIRGFGIFDFRSSECCGGVCPPRGAAPSGKWEIPDESSRVPARQGHFP